MLRPVATGLNRLLLVFNNDTIFATATDTLRNRRQPQPKKDQTAVRFGPVAVFFWFSELDFQTLFTTSVGCKKRGLLMHWEVGNVNSNYDCTYVDDHKAWHNANAQCG
jgi:hypothetical protein